jgi:hypothetical protein
LNWGRGSKKVFILKKRDKGREKNKKGKNKSYKLKGGKANYEMH